MTIPIFFLTLRDLIKVSRNKNIRFLEPFTGFLTLAWFLIVGSAIFLEFFI
jgi:hypothetical protein